MRKLARKDVIQVTERLLDGNNGRVVKYVSKDFVVRAEKENTILELNKRAFGIVYGYPNKYELVRINRFIKDGKKLPQFIEYRRA